MINIITGQASTTFWFNSPSELRVLLSPLGYIIFGIEEKKKYLHSG